MFGEYDVDIRIGGHRNDHTAIGIQAHDLRVARSTDVLSQSFTEHVILGEPQSERGENEVTQKKVGHRA